MERGTFGQLDLNLVRWIFGKYFAPDIIVSFKQCNRFFNTLCNGILLDEIKLSNNIISCDGKKGGHMPIRNIPGYMVEHESFVRFDWDQNGSRRQYSSPSAKGLTNNLFINESGPNANDTHIYSFMLRPGEYQPSGTINWSRPEFEIPMWCYWCKRKHQPKRKQHLQNNKKESKK